MMTMEQNNKISQQLVVLPSIEAFFCEPGMMVVCKTTWSKDIAKYIRASQFLIFTSLTPIIVLL